MRYLLRERFLGACFGGVIGERLAEQDKLILSELEYQQISWLKINQDITTQIPLNDGEPLSWEKMTTSCLEKITISKIALAVSPIILYYHDNLYQLEILLHQTVQYWQISLTNLDGILWWSVAISLILREKLDPEDLWQQLTFTCQMLKSSLSQDLMSLKSLFDRGLSITELATELSILTNPNDVPFLLSLYCFSQTPENFTLTIKQAIRVQNKTPHLVALTGFLSGAYNSRAGVPVNWEKFCQNRDDHQKIYQLGSRVFALWAGAYFLGNNVNISAIVATPRTLQNRSHLKIISQKEYE